MKMNVSTDEALNINQFGTYTFAYGIVFLSILFGLLTTAVILGIPLHGIFGAATVFRFILRILAVVLIALAAYAFYCYRFSNGTTRLRASLQIFSMAMVFAVLGVEYSGLTKLILSTLSTLGNNYPNFCLPQPLS